MTNYTFEDLAKIETGSYADPLHYFFLWDVRENIVFCRQHELPLPPDHPVRIEEISGTNTVEGFRPDWLQFSEEEKAAFTVWANQVIAARWASYQAATAQVAAIAAEASALMKNEFFNSHEVDAMTSKLKYKFDDFAAIKHASYDDDIHYFSLWTIEENAQYCRQNELPNPPVIPVILWMPDDPNMMPGFRPDWIKFGGKDKVEYTLWANKVLERRWYDYRGAVEGITIRIADDESFGPILDFDELQSEVDKLNDPLSKQEDYSSWVGSEDIHEIRTGDEIPFGPTDAVSTRTIH